MLRNLDMYLMMAQFKTKERTGSAMRDVTACPSLTSQVCRFAIVHAKGMSLLPANIKVSF